LTGSHGRRNFRSVYPHPTETFTARDTTYRRSTVTAPVDDPLDMVIRRVNAVSSQRPRPG